MDHGSPIVNLEEDKVNFSPPIPKRSKSIVSNANLGSSKMIQGQQTLDKFLVFKSDLPSGTVSNPNNSLQSLESETGGKFR